MNAQDAVRTEEATRTRDEGTRERVPFESPPPLDSPPGSEVVGAYVGGVLPLIVFSAVFALYAGIGCGLYLLLGSLP